MSGTSAKTSPTVKIVSITPRRRWAVGEKVCLVEACLVPALSVFLGGTDAWCISESALPLRKQMREGGKAAIEAQSKGLKK